MDDRPDNDMGGDMKPNMEGEGGRAKSDSIGLIKKRAQPGRCLEHGCSPSVRTAWINAYRLIALLGIFAGLFALSDEKLAALCFAGGLLALSLAEMAIIARALEWRNERAWMADAAAKAEEPDDGMA